MDLQNVMMEKEMITNKIETKIQEEVSIQVKWNIDHLINEEMCTTNYRSF